MDNTNNENEENIDSIAECTINNRTFVITADKRIYEKVGNKYTKCSENDKETEFLKKYIQPPKSLDIDER